MWSTQVHDQVIKWGESKSACLLSFSLGQIYDHSEANVKLEKPDQRTIQRVRRVWGSQTNPEWSENSTYKSRTFGGIISSSCQRSMILVGQRMDILWNAFRIARRYVIMQEEFQRRHRSFFPRSWRRRQVVWNVRWQARMQFWRIC